MSRWASFTFLAVLSIASCLPVTAATTVQMTVTDYTDTPPIVDRSVLTVQGRDLRLDAGFRGGSEPAASTIYHGDKKTLTVLLHQTRQAMIFDSRTGARIAKFLAKTRKQWDQALQQLPEAERDQARKRLEQRYPAMADEGAPSDQRVVLKKMSDTGSTNGFDWVRWEAWDGDTKMREYLVTGAENIPGGRDTIRVISDMSSYLQQLTRDMSGQIPMQNPFLEIANLDGFPVVIRGLADGDVARETVIDSAATARAGKEAFRNPGYTVLDPIELLAEMRP